MLAYAFHASFTRNSGSRPPAFTAGSSWPRPRWPRAYRLRLQERPHVSSPATSGSRWSYVRAAIIVAAVAVLLAVQRATTRTAGVDIEDRSVDFIVGLPLLLAALVMLLIGPVSLSTFFWLWRLDLLTLPVFVAGAV